MSDEFSLKAEIAAAKRLADAAERACKEAPAPLLHRSADRGLVFKVNPNAARPAATVADVTVTRADIEQAIGDAVEIIGEETHTLIDELRTEMRAENSELRAEIAALRRAIVNKAVTPIGRGRDVVVAA